ncbi:MAG: hypothetical protein JW864_18760 [Spirochaetes bacterium]|nr:hypothetical protein [Spirochaetota bacterium]
MKNKIFLIIIIILCLNTVYAQDKNADAAEKAGIPQKEKVCFFNYQDKSTNDKYRYLSYIIPKSVGADLKNIGNYEIINIPDKIDYLDKNSSAEERAKFINGVSRRGREYKADYVIAGYYNIEENNLIVYSQILDIERQEIIYVDETENKISAIILEMVEEVTDDIKEELLKAREIREELREEERKRKEAEKRANTSPFLGLYDFFNGMTFGVNYGKMHFMDSWTEDFTDTEILTFYLSYCLGDASFLKDTSFIRNLGFTAKYDYFSTRNEDYFYHSSEYLDFTGYGLNIFYLFRINDMFNLIVSGGGGFSEIEYLYEGEYDYETGTEIIPGYSKTDNDFYYNAAFSVNFIFSNLKVESGVSYYYIQYPSDSISFFSVYFGLGYRI